MSSERSRGYLVSLTHELSALPRESERVVFHSGRHCTGRPWRGPHADALSALLGLGPKGGAGMSQHLDGHWIGGLGRLPGLGLTTAEAAP
jgi:hypothetical protein